MTTEAAAAIKGPWSGSRRQNSSMSTGELLCALYVDSNRQVSATSATH
jgi:hypothetical protein